MTQIAKYRDALNHLLKVCRQRGITVRFVHDKRTRDFVGMNTATARVMGFPMAARTILVDSNLNYEAKYHTLKHEYDEMRDVAKGIPYWTAHCRALKSEKILVGVK